MYMGRNFTPSLKTTGSCRCTSQTTALTSCNHLIVKFTSHLMTRKRCNFSKWYAEEVSKQLEADTPVDEVHVDVWMSIMKELGSNWFVMTTFKLTQTLSRMGSHKAGITIALENVLPN